MTWASALHRARLLRRVLRGPGQICQWRRSRSGLPSKLSRSLSSVSNESDGHGHGHGHGHDHGGSYELAKLRGKALQVTLLGFGFNAALAGAQAFAGWYCHSAALTSDAAHTLGDCVSDVVTLASVRFMIGAEKAAWPYGIGKVDSLGALGVSGLLLMGGAGALLHSASLLWEILGGAELLGVHGHGLGHEHGHAHGAACLVSEGSVNLMAVATCLATMLCKESLFRATRRVAERLDSSVLIANAWHHRSDVFSSGIVLVGLLGRTFLHSALDPLAGAVVAIVILRISATMGRRAVVELLDCGLPEHSLYKLRLKAETALGRHSSDELWAGRGLLLAEVSGRRAGPELWLRLRLRLGGGPDAWKTVPASQLAELEAALLEDMRKDGLRGLQGLKLLQS